LYPQRGMDAYPSPCFNDFGLNTSLYTLYNMLGKSFVVRQGSFILYVAAQGTHRSAAPRQSEADSQLKCGLRIGTARCAIARRAMQEREW